MFPFFMVWVAIMLACVVIGHRKGNPIGAFFLGLVLGPLGLVIVLLSGNKNLKICHACGMKIPKVATVCPFCRKDNPA